MADAGQTQPVCLLGLVVHILVAGATFDLSTRKASPGTLAGDN
jgi:cyanophycinase